MTSELKKKLFPADLAWNIINNLDKFNSRSGLIERLSEKFNYLSTHSLFGIFTDLYAEAVTYYNKHGMFPDITYLNKRFPDGKLIKIIKGEPFSMTLYEELIKQLDYEILIKKFNDTLGKSNTIEIEKCLELSKDLARFAASHEEVPQDTKEGLINSYKDYAKEFRGLKTGIKALDDCIGVLGYRSLSVVAAPSGHGKSTTAITMAYNMAVNYGMHVCYASFEVPAEHIWFNLVSLESANCEDTNKRLPSSKIKESLLDEDEQEYYEEHMRNLLYKMKISGGWIDVFDQTKIQCDTFEDFCSSLEERAENIENKHGKLGRPADLIIVDNVDNLQVLKSSEKDETTKVNQYIIALDKFSKTYYNGVGTTMLLLTQVNRTGLKKLNNMESNGDQEVSIDVTCIQKFNALYEKATTVIVVYSSPKMRTTDEMRMLPVKLRNRALPTRPISVKVDFEYSRTGGHYEEHFNTADEVERIVDASEAGVDFGDLEDEDLSGCC